MMYPGDLCIIRRSNEPSSLIPVYDKNFIFSKNKVCIGCFKHMCLIICSLTFMSDSYSSHYIMADNGLIGWIYESSKFLMNTKSV
jgi:hypothetical protein